MSFTNNNMLGSNRNFINIVRMAILKSAVAIAGENPNDMSPLKAEKRHELANMVFATSSSQSKEFALTIVSLGTIECIVNPDGTLNYTGSQTLDKDVEYTVNSIWDDRAGVTYKENQVI